MKDYNQMICISNDVEGDKGQNLIPSTCFDIHTFDDMVEKV